MRRFKNSLPGKRLLQRREYEFKLFRSIEAAIELPKVRKGFDNMNQFVDLAKSVMGRRKARSGKSLEIYTQFIFEEEGLSKSRYFSSQVTTARGRKPDFVFPTEEAYLDPSFFQERLRMLAVKTTCKDRWRQVLNESDRKHHQTHLLTLQEGFAHAQHREMTESGVKLVVLSR